MQNTKRKKRQKKSKNQNAAPKRKCPNFVDTSLAHLIKANAPIEYQLMLSATDVSKKRYSPDLIEAIGYVSANPFFRSVEFRQELMRYRNPKAC